MRRLGNCSQNTHFLQEEEKTCYSFPANPQFKKSHNISGFFQQQSESISKD